jgi:hypothetical protein
MGFGLLASHLPGAMLQGQPAGLYFQHLRYRDGMNDCITVITVRWEARWEQVKTLGSEWRPKTAARSREQADSYVHHCGFIKFLARKQMK